jgi:hypothetical protein
MSTFLKNPICSVCQSQELEIVSNVDFGPMTLCGECGYSRISTFEDISPVIIQTIAS